MAEYEISYLLQKRALFKIGMKASHSQAQCWATLASGRDQGQLAVSIRGGCLAVAEREGCQDQSSR